MTTISKHLWEIDHPYYCSDTNYFSNDCYQKWDSFDTFFKEENDGDFDYNLLFRWDWNLDDDKINPLEKPFEMTGDLKIFWMGQRKGLFRSSIIRVCADDEQKVIEFLKPRWEHMRKLWEPLS